MDRLDLRILRQLFQAHTLWPARPGLIASYRQIARHLRTSPGTVRNRLREMLRTGFLQGIDVYPNPYALGRQSVSYAVEVAGGVDKTEATRQIERLDGVVFFEHFHGPLLGIGIAAPDERSLEGTIGRINAIVGAPGGMLARVQHPPVHGELTPAEWALVARLMRGRFSTYDRLAAETGTSVRTLKRRLARLTETNAVLTFPNLDFRALAGGATADLLVQFVDPRARAQTEPRIREYVDAWLIYAGAWEQFVIYRLILPNVAVADELAIAVRRFDGVLSARAEFTVGLVPHLENFLPEVDARASRRSRSDADSGSASAKVGAGPSTRPPSDSLRPSPLPHTVGRDRRRAAVPAVRTQ